MARIFGDLEIKYVREVIESGKLGYWKEGMVDQFEKAFAKWVGVKFGAAQNSAITALARAISISGATAGTEVICDPISYHGVLATLYFNAVPRFADLKYETYLVNPESVLENITKWTRAIIITNLWGLCAELDALRAICDEHNIIMIEDCSHALGAYWKGKHAGTYGHIGVFDFSQNSQMTTGEGGMIVTDSQDLYDRLHNEWSLGEETPPFMMLNFRMNEVTAAIGFSQIRRVKAYMEEYNRNLSMMDKAIAGCTWLKNRVAPEGTQQSGYLWACLWEGDKVGLDFDQFKQICDEVNVPLEFGLRQNLIYNCDILKTPTAYHHNKCPIRCPYYISNYRYEEGLCPVAEQILPRIITSDVMEISERDMEKRASSLRKAIQKMEKHKG
jgi:dTDP-4-amino-4,6-dideoxygalactose transaminase